MDFYEKDLIEEQPLRRKVAEIHTSRVITCLPMDNIGDVAKKMSTENVSSVVVRAFNEKPVGIITEKDLVRKILSADAPDFDQKAHAIMSSRLITVKPDDFAYRALLMMIKYNINHVVVVDDDEVLHGIVTIKDLIRNRNTGALSVVRQIEKVDTYSGLSEVIKEVDQVLQALLNERSYASEICALVTELYDRITRKTIQIAEKQMVNEGLGEPPVKYCYISMGSAGRKEQFTRTDQDNGIIYEDPPEDKSKETASYFLALGHKIVMGLEQCGFRLCKGKVMANNPQWCNPLSGWKSNISRWVEKLDGKNIRNMTIFLDYRFIEGNQSLSEDLKNFTTSLFTESVHALLFMAEDDLRHRVPLNMFGRIITDKLDGEEGKLNLKSAVMVHLVDCVRLFALREGIRETNSFDRIRRLKELGTFRTDDAEYLEAAYEALLMFKIINAVENMKRGLAPDSLLEPSRLSKKENARLKKSMLSVSRLQTLVAHTFRVHKA